MVFGSPRRQVVLTVIPARDFPSLISSGTLSVICYPSCPPLEISENDEISEYDCITQRPAPRFPLAAAAGAFPVRRACESRWLR